MEKEQKPNWPASLDELLRGRPAQQDHHQAGHRGVVGIKGRIGVFNCSLPPKNGSKCGAYETLLVTNKIVTASGLTLETSMGVCWRF